MAMPTMYQCQCCDHVATVILNHHYITEHGITKQEADFMFDKPQKVHFDWKKAKENHEVAKALHTTAPQSTPNPHRNGKRKYQR